MGAKATVWRARRKFRDADGKVRLVERWAPTKGKAETLKAVLVERQTPIKSADMRVIDAGRLWLEQVKRSGLADSTKRQYEDNFKRYVEASSIKGLTLREVNNVAAIERYLQGIADANGDGAARTARKILSGVLGLAVRYGVLPHAVTASVKPAKRAEPKESKHDTERALTREERAKVLQVCDEDPHEDSKT